MLLPGAVRRTAHDGNPPSHQTSTQEPAAGLFDDTDPLHAEGIRRRGRWDARRAPRARRIAVPDQAGESALVGSIDVVEVRWVDRCEPHFDPDLTGAGLGAKSDRRRNFEAGVLTDEAALVGKVMAQFDSVWMGSHCEACGRQAFCADFRELLPGGPESSADREDAV